MIHLALRTEYSFGKCFAPIDKIVEIDCDTIGIADEDNTYGHIPFSRAMKQHNKKAIYGVRLTICHEMKVRFIYGGYRVILLAKNNTGLKEIYQLVSLAWAQFYYIPRLSHDQFCGISDNIITINLSNLAPSHMDWCALNEDSPDSFDLDRGVYIDNNNYINYEDKETYEIMAGSHKRGDGRVYNFQLKSEHIISEGLAEKKWGADQVWVTHDIADQCNARIDLAKMVEYDGDADIGEVCELGAKDRKLPNTQEYEDRYVRELNMIEEKGYSDYFLIVSDLIRWAKSKKILVGPSRGSSAGSLVCYLMGITEVDPIKYGLVFERFIDINRFDLPDIDIDFPDNKREMVIKYLVKKYGADKVASLANINRFKGKSAINEFAFALGAPPWLTEPVKNVLIERMSGDERANKCIYDTLHTTEEGKKLLKEYPMMKLAANVEGHASHAGKHAAGIIVSTQSLDNYGSINARPGKDENKSIIPQIMMDKHGAEYVNLLKIDILGLRTLSILSDLCTALRMSIQDLYSLRLDDPDVFHMINEDRLTGVFQFEGRALQNICRSLNAITNFNDLVAITSLARPGALSSGGTARYIKYKNKEAMPRYYNQTHRQITEESMGIVIYQEQMMRIAREIGGMSWEDVSKLRKAASKSLGDAYVAKFKEIFINGARSNGLDKDNSELLWADISATGSWTFNKSHAVSYGLISYWTAWFKAHHPMEFAVANLNHSANKESAIRLLRDLTHKENLEFEPVGKADPQVYWNQKDGKLYGGLTNIHGIGVIKAKKIIKDIELGIPLSESIQDKLDNPITDFDEIFPMLARFGTRYHGCENEAESLTEIDKLKDGEYSSIVGIVTKKTMVDRNSIEKKKKDGRTEDVEESERYNMKIHIEDDTGYILCMVMHKNFESVGGREFFDSLEEGESILETQGNVNEQFGIIFIDYCRNHGKIES